MDLRTGAFAALLLAGLGATGPAAHALSLHGFKSGLVAFLLERISVPGQFEVSADKVERAEAGTTVLAGVHISDAEGEWFRAKKFVLRWSPSRLLKGEVQIDTLHLDGGVLARLPTVPGAGQESSDAPPAQGDGERVQWPRSPIAVSVRELLVTNFQVSATVLPGGLGVSGRGSFHDEGEEQKLDLSVTRVDAVRGGVDLSAVRNFSTGVLTVRVVADEDAGGLVAKLGALPANTPVGLRLQGDGTAAAWSGGLELELGELLQVSGVLDAAWRTRIGATLDGRIRPGPGMEAALREAIGPEATLRAKVVEDGDGRFQIERAAIDSASISARLAGSVIRETGDLDLSLVAEVAPAGARRLSALSAPLAFAALRLDASLKGPTNAISIVGTGSLSQAVVADFRASAVTLHTRVVTETSGYNLEVDVEAVDPEGPDARYAAILGDRLSLRLRGLWSNGQLELSRAEVRSPGFTSNVVGTLGLAGPLTPRLRYVADIPELRSLAQLVGLRAAGRVRAQGTIAGRVGATEGQRAGTLEILGQLEVTRAQVNDESIGTVRIRHDAVLGDTVRAGFDLRMDSPSFGAGKASGRFEQGPQKWRVDHLDVDLLGVRASGTARGAYVNQQVVGVQGEFLLDIASLADIGRVAGLALAGNGGGKIRVSAEREGTAVIDMALQNLEVEGLALSSASIHGSVAGLTAKLEPRLTLQAHGGTGPNGKLRALSVVLNGPLDALALKAEVSAEFESQPVTLSALAKADLDGPSKMFRFDALRATLAADTVSLGTPLTVLVDGTEVTMDGLDLLLPDGGRLAGTAQWSSEALRGSMDLNGAPLRFITALLDVPVAQGTLDAKVEVNTGAEAPVLDAGVHIDDVRMEGVDPGAVAQGVPPVSVDATASWDGESLAVRSELIGEFGPPVTVQAKIAMHATDTWLPEVGLHEPLEAVIEWRGKLARLFALFPLPDHLLAGDTVLNIRVGGSAHDPAVSGALEISRGRYENLLLGTIIDDFSLTTKFTEQGALALALDGTDGGRCPYLC